MLDVTLRMGAGETKPENMDAAAALEPSDGAYTISGTDWLWAEIRVKKSSSLRLQIGWLALSDDGDILPLWPPPGAEPSFAEGDVVYVGRDREQALPLGLRADQRTSWWTLKVLACTVPDGGAALDIWSLEQASVQEAFAAAINSARGATRGALRDRSATPAAERPAWHAWDFRVAVTSRKGAGD
jgi:hypothetical protein